MYSGRSEGSSQLYVHEMDAFGARAISGTHGAHSPFFSPDGDWVGFFTSGGELKKVALDGGAPLLICEVSPESYGASWGLDDTIVFAPSADDLMRVSANGGAPEVIAVPDRQSGELAYYWPQILPGGEAILFTLWRAGGLDLASVAVLSLTTEEVTILVEVGTGARYSPTGHLVYAAPAGLLAAPFDPVRLEVTGSSLSILDSVYLSEDFGAAYFTFSGDGTLVYLSGTGQEAGRLAWVDREGDAVPITEERRMYKAPRLSPDGTQVAVHVDEGDGNTDTWIYDIQRRTLTLLTFDGDNSVPVWSPDGERVAFSSGRSGSYDLMWKRADGGGDAEVLLRQDNGQFPISFSRDGRVLAFYEVHPFTKRDIWVLPLEGDRTPIPFLVTPANERAPMFSPDGRWLAYVSDESGRDETYVQSYPGPGGKQQISPDGGTEPLWAHTGRELFYRVGNKVMVVDIEPGSEFKAGAPRELFEGAFLMSTPVFAYPRWDISSDGKRFLMVMSEPAPAPSRLSVVFNWFEELAQLAPGQR